VQNDSNINNGILFIHAYNVQIRVSENQLLIDYRNPVKGEKTRKTSLRLNRATSGLKRLVISGDDGYISLHALRWLAEIKAAIMQIGFDNQLYLASIPPGNDDPALRRYQVLAGFTPLGAEIVRTLLTAKIQGQIGVMRSLGAGVAPLHAALQAIREREDPSEMMGFEGQASANYWTAWETVPVKFAKKDLHSLPEHWGAFRKRASELEGRPRKATNPANAMLNYLYAILKGETTTALQSVGLDPGIGLLHSDNPSTPNLSLDVMEAVRPTLDAWFLSFLEKRMFTRQEFFEMQDGSVRLGGPLRQELSEFGPFAFSRVAPWAEYVVHTLEQELKGEVTFGTPLTQDNRKRGRTPYRKRETKRVISPKVVNRCLQCGKQIPNDYIYCTACFEQHRPEKIANFAQSGADHLKRLHDRGMSPGHSEEAERKRGASQSARIAARKAWEAANPGRLEAERQRFVLEIYPLLQAFTIYYLAQVCHCTRSYASLIKKGIQVPHPAFYEDLEKAINQKIK
jgi:CRISPR-associated endonuclease Cas1